MANHLLLSTALVTTSPLRALVRVHLGAMAPVDRQLIGVTERPKVGDSIDFDAATRPQFPQHNRWDYLLSVPTASRLIGLEPHSAKDSEIRVVIAKRQHAVTYLQQHLPPKNRVTKWLWVTRGSVGFTSTERARRILNQNGIAFAGRKVRSLG